MVILSGKALTRKGLALDDNDFNSNDLKWSERPSRLQERFLVLRKLGQGTYGKVQLALNKEINQEVAIKTIKKAKIENDEDMLRIRREIHIMTSISHPHIIHIYEVFETRQKIVIVMQYASGGELYDYLGCHQTLPEEEARRIFRQIASAIYYCHKNQICHRDLKLENILLDENGNTQIADFGLSNIFDERRRMNTFCGSPLYASPEIVKGTPYKGPEVDCWSLGVLLFTLIYGKMPFDGRNFKELVSQISEGRYEEPVNKSSASNLIQRLLTPDISKRATIADVCKDSWVNQGSEVSLLEIAERMAMKAGLKRADVSTEKLYLETNPRNGCGNSFLHKLEVLPEHRKNGKPCSDFIKNHETLNCVSSRQCDKSFLHEKILNYDVHFVINKIIVAVEASFKTTCDENSTHKLLPEAKEMPIPSLKIWSKNGENNVSDKVKSAYVIPIFEVTSVVPKPTDNAINYEHHDTHSQKRYTRSTVVNGFIDKTSQCVSKNEMQKSEGRKDKNEQAFTNPVNESFLKAQVSQNEKALSKDCTPPFSIGCGDFQEKANTVNKSTVSGSSKEIDCGTVMKADDNSVSNEPLLKPKQQCDNYLFSGQRHFGLFARSKNHSLTLARILSLNYEKILMKPFRVPQHKKKAPGKVVIPATFDPTTLTDVVNERKTIVVFPTVSVSENKEKIEKKIDRIKKAAHNMNSIRRSNTKNRLKIQKYLLTQAKKMQDLVCDEQRSANGSIDQINKLKPSLGISKKYCKLGKGTMDFSLMFQQSENVFPSQLSNSFNDPLVNNITTETLDKINPKEKLLMTQGFSKWKNCFPEGTVQRPGQKLEFYALAKSKSEIELPCYYLNYISHFSDCSNFKIFLPDKCLNSTMRESGNVMRHKSQENFCLIRSASDSSGFNTFEKKFERMKTGKHSVTDQYIIGTQERKLINKELFLNSITNRYHEKCTAREGAGRSNSSTLSTELDCKSDTTNGFSRILNSYYADNEPKLYDSKTNNAENCTNFKNNDKSGKQMSKCLLPKSFLVNEKLESKDAFQNGYVINGQNGVGDMSESSTCSSILENRYTSGGRRNTLSCFESCDNAKRQGYTGSLEDNCNPVTRVWNTCEDGNSLLNYKTQFLSSPNLHQFSLDVNNDSKSMDGLNIEANRLERFFCNSYPNNLSGLDSSDAKSAFVKKITSQNNRINRSFCDVSKSETNRHKTISEETMDQSEQNDIIHRLLNERKMSSASQQTNGSKSPFLSNFLNDLDRRDQLSKFGDNSLNQRRPSRNNISFSKRSKSESRSKSFLQLLSLKRIQEAEKELEKAQNDSAVDAEEENSGSLLEALKNHGYKNVISQRFLVDESNLGETYDFKHPSSSLTSRKARSESSRLNFMHYDTPIRYTTSPYDLNDLDYTSTIMNGVTPKASYEVFQNYAQKPPRQSMNDWLAANQNIEYLCPLNSEYGSSTSSEEPNLSNETGRYRYQFQKEREKSLEEEASASEYADTAEHTENGSFIGEIRNRDYSADYSGIVNPTKTERKYSLFSSASSDDEREESVQDRIWRKSFYSRFNNSALSRKERSPFLESDFLTDSRAGFLNNFCSTLKAANHERSEYHNLSEYSKTLPLKRVHSKKYGPILDKTIPGSRVKTKTVKSPVSENLLENSGTKNKKADIAPKSILTCEAVESEPEQ